MFDVDFLIVQKSMTAHVLLTNYHVSLSLPSLVSLLLYMGRIALVSIYYMQGDIIIAVCMYVYVCSLCTCMSHMVDIGQVSPPWDVCML